MNEPRFFSTAAAFGRWLESNHARKTELWVGLYKKHAAHRGMTYLQAVEEALCWGWIDGHLKRLDEDRIKQRFTPRKARSTWSLVNVRKVKALIKAGRMHSPGLAAFKARDPERTGIYSFERAPASFTPAQQRAFKKTPGAWKWFAAQAPSYRRTCTHWVVSAKQEMTRARRLESLIAHCADGKKLRQFTPLDRRTK